MLGHLLCAHAVIFFKVYLPIFPLVSPSLVGGPFPHPCVIRENM